jgi:hypothetical protein
VAADWGYLAENIRAGHALHDSLRDLAAKLITSDMGKGAAVNLLRGLMDTAAVPHDERWQQRYDDIPRLVESAAAKRSEANDIATAAARFKLEPFNTVEAATVPNYLVKGLVPRQALTVIWGPPKSGKSFWTFDLFMHVALGCSYRGRKVQGGPVVYLALEGGGGFRARVAAWRQEYLEGAAARVPFYLLAVPVDLVADCDGLIASIEEQAVAPAVVVIDTLNRALAGSENNPEDMASFIRAADTIRGTFNCAVAVIHHCGIDAKRPRGHTSLTGAADAQIAIVRDDQTGIIQAKIEFMKDGETGVIIPSRLEAVTLGNDDEGDPITSCVVVPVDGSGFKRRPKLPDSAKLALNLLAEAILDHGVPPPASTRIPSGTKRVVPLDAFRRHFYAGTASDGTAAGHQRKAFTRATERLQTLGYIGIWNDVVWLAGHAGQDGTS